MTQGTATASSSASSEVQQAPQHHQAQPFGDELAQQVAQPPVPHRGVRPVTGQEPQAAAVGGAARREVQDGGHLLDEPVAQVGQPRRRKTVQGDGVPVLGALDAPLDLPVLGAGVGRPGHAGRGRLDDEDP
ncbi:hypothetical protein GCM10020254_59290 [Streptomyces goshikiensis]